MPILYIVLALSIFAVRENKIAKMSIKTKYKHVIRLRRKTVGLQYPLKMSLVMRKPTFCICENKDADQLRGDHEAVAVTAKLISAFVFTTRIVQCLFFLNPKFLASNHLLWLYSPVCVGPGQKPCRPVFSQRGINDVKLKVCFALQSFSHFSNKKYLYINSVIIEM